jgi:hypothetical protein
MKRQRITLEIDFNPKYVDPPADWNWADVTDTLPEHIRIVSFEPVVPTPGDAA